MNDTFIYRGEFNSQRAKYCGNFCPQLRVVVLV